VTEQLAIASFTQFWSFFLAAIGATLGVKIVLAAFKRLEK
jgi:hypothetical protein